VTGDQAGQAGADHAEMRAARGPPRAGEIRPVDHSASHVYLPCGNAIGQNGDLNA